MLGRGVVEQDDFPRAEHVLERRRGQIRCTDSGSLQRDSHRFARDFGLGLDAVLVAARQD